MKKTNVIHKIVICLFVTFSIHQVNIFAVPNFTFAGAGTETNPFQISTLEDLKELADSVTQFDYYSLHASKNLHFILTNDITEPVTFCIGSNDNITNVFPFTGIFDGQGYSIALAIDGCPTSHNSALFPYIDTRAGEAIIKNLTVNGYVNGFGSIAAGIVGFNSHATNTLTVSNCVNVAKITAQYSAGGIIQSAYSFVVIENCINIGTVESINNISNVVAGGIVGYARGSINSIFINNCVNYGLIKSHGVAGGILGDGTGNMNLYTISNCFNSGVVYGKNASGCIIGKKEKAILLNNHYDKQMCGEPEPSELGE